MLIEALQRVEAAAQEALAAVNRGPLSNAEARQVLAVCKPAMAALSAARTAAAQAVAGSERHGDGGTQVLADAAGLTRREAHSQVKTAAVLQTAPAVRDAVESGRVSQANARRLAEAIEKTGADMVACDEDLLAKAESMRPEQFGREARRWTADRQTDGGEADYRRMRARRRLRIFDGDDGMMHLHGEFDPVTGQRIANRLSHAARRLHYSDQRSVSKSRRRSYPQCLADALDDLTAARSGDNAAAGGAAARCSGEPFADVCVVAHVDDETGSLIGELSDGSRLPASVLDELTCNATITGVIFDRPGKPIWKTTAGRKATETQRRILNARWGGCFHCRANFAICQPHHIDPVSHGGQTHVGNLVPACWGCHQLIHRDGWQIHKSPDGNHTLHPPQRVNYGPAHMPEHPSPVVAVPPLFTAPLPEPAPEPEGVQAGPGLDPGATRAEPAHGRGATRAEPAHGRGATRAGPAPSPTAARASPEPGTRPGPTAARAVLRHARTAHAARDGPN